MGDLQVYCDWSYIWSVSYHVYRHPITVLLLTLDKRISFRSLLYFAQLHSSIIIVLKASLKWVPMVGPAMQMFRFIFMQRNWNADKLSLGKMLTKFGEQASRSFDPFVLLFCQYLTIRNPILTEEANMGPMQSQKVHWFHLTRGQYQPSSPRRLASRMESTLFYRARQAYCSVYVLSNLA